MRAPSSSCTPQWSARRRPAPISIEDVEEALRRGDEHLVADDGRRGSHHPVGFSEPERGARRLPASRSTEDVQHSGIRLATRQVEASVRHGRGRLSDRLVRLTDPNGRAQGKTATVELEGVRTGEDRVVPRNGARLQGERSRVEPAGPAWGQVRDVRTVHRVL